MYWSLVSVRCSVQDIQQWDGSAGSLKGEASGQVSRRSNRALEGEAWDVQVSSESGKNVGGSPGLILFRD